MYINKVVDTKGLYCAMIVVKVKKAIDELASGQIFEIETMDQGAKNDLTAWVNISGHELVDYKEEKGC
jgi:TusA-related sulfurtransferase